MLELRNIKKDYPAGNGVVAALKGISIQFRRNEFVAILGPSGCGKTTALNIIGGLDQYTSGDLIINGVSTKNYRDRDWDAYRNHSVGFVFQSYNLIPHQSVLQNVELALSLSGVSKKERRQRAIAALERVGLGDQLRKRPSEMSGGQMQRVAIARAIVNDPDIILADEPTGALDTETSLQVMDILKEISRDRLVIMVTHNPDLAQTYATRTIRMLDGEITSDSLPLTEEEVALERQVEKPRPASRKERKPSMSFATSFALSLKNLFTKRGRTLLTAFAGSIGIIGIALIYAVSQGMTTYIDTIQEETLSSYPLTLEAAHMDMGSLMATFIGQASSTQEHEMDRVYQKSMVYDMVNALNNLETQENDLAAFKIFVEQERGNPDSTSGLYAAVSGVQYTYDIDLLVYTRNVEGQIIPADMQQLMQDVLLKNLGMDVTSLMGLTEDTGMMSMAESMSAMGPMGTSIRLWQEMLPGDNGQLINPVLDKQYEIVYGSWPNSYDEVVLVLDENNELDDMTLYALGLRTREEIDAIVTAALTQSNITVDNRSWSYEEICGLEFRVILPSDCYHLDESTGLYVDLRQTDAGLAYLYDNATVLRVSGIIRPREDVLSPMLTSAIAYTSQLTEHVITASQSSPALMAQLADPSTDVLTGLPFRDTTGSVSIEEKAAAFKDYIATLDTEGKAAVCITIASIPTSEQISESVQQIVGPMTREDIEAQMLAVLTAQMGMNEKDVQNYLSGMTDDALIQMFTAMVTEQFTAQYALQVSQQLSTMPTAQLAGMLSMALMTATPEDCAAYYDVVLTFSDSSYEDNLRLLGYVDLASPATINLYAASFEDKDVIEAAIALYNEGVEEFEQIAYTDYVGLMMSSITTIINAITYVLIAFVAVSLIVSSIMIGVITLISVQERTKEIGILRAIGASRRNVSSMFNAETIIIGFSSGLIGVGLTYLLCIPINAILHQLTGIGNLSAYLPVPVALILVTISTVLTLFSGIIPSRSAAKKDPVVALRSE